MLLAIPDVACFASRSKASCELRSASSPDGGFVLRWTNADISRERLGYDETGRFLERKLRTCHPSNVEHVRNDLMRARNGEGETLFDFICAILRNHGPDGEEPEDGVVLELA